MKKLIFILLFGLFLLGPPGETFADSNESYDIEMVCDQSIDFDQPDVFDVNVTVWKGGNQSFEVMNYLSVDVSKSYVNSQITGAFCYSLDENATTYLSGNYYLKRAGTERLCSLDSGVNNKLKANSGLMDMRIRGHDFAQNA